MKKWLAALAVALFAVQASALVEYFPVTGDGSFDIWPDEGYCAGGNTDWGGYRLGKKDENIGFMSFAGSTGDLTGQTMAEFLQGKTVNSATLYLCGMSTFGNYQYISTLRCGNDGAIVEDPTDGVGYTWDNPGFDLTGCSEPFAWRAASGAATAPYGYASKGAGVDVAWKMAPGATNQDGFVGGDEVIWNGLGFDADTGLWPVQVVMGINGDQWANGAARMAGAGQIVDKDLTSGNPLKWNPANYVVGTTDPRGKVPGGTGGTGTWYSVPLSADLLDALVNDPYTKALAFTSSAIELGGPMKNNDQAYCKEYVADGIPGGYEAYIMLDVTSTAIVGDINGDGHVDVGDLQALAAAWGSHAPASPNWNANADCNNDGYVNVGDLQIVIAHWGEPL